MRAKARKNVTIGKIEIPKGTEGQVMAVQVKAGDDKDAGDYYLMNFPHAKYVQCPKELFDLLAPSQKD